ncbi:MAG: ATP-binding protein [Planctomycetes bacterium]|nr:ATP-binding protein [Planctomycetota bacterium]
MSGLIGEDALVQILRESLDPLAFSVIQKFLKHSSCESKSLAIRVPNVFYKELLEKNISNDLVQKLANFGVNNISFVVDETVAVIDRRNLDQQAVISKDADNISRDVGKVPIDPLKSFPTFIVGGSNRLAFLASQYFIDGSENVFCLYGTSSSGKSHLVHAIGNESISKTKKTYYLPSEQFITEYINSIKQKKMNSFRSNLTDSDVLLFDDFDLLTVRQSFIDEFSHLINHYILYKKKIVIATQKHPSSYNIDSRLKSRLCSGLVVKVMPPSHDLKKACVRIELSNSGITFDESVVEKLSDYFSGIGELFAGVRKVIIFSKLMGKYIDLDLIKEVLQLEIIEICPEIETFIKTISEAYNISPDQIRNRNRKTSYYRQLLYYLLVKCSGFSTREAAKHCNISNSTVSYAIKKIEFESRMNMSFQKELSLLIEKVNTQERKE